MHLYCEYMAKWSELTLCNNNATRNQVSARGTITNVTTTTVVDLRVQHTNDRNNRAARPLTARALVSYTANAISLVLEGETILIINRQPFWLFKRSSGTGRTTRYRSQSSIEIMNVRRDTTNAATRARRHLLTPQSIELLIYDSVLDV